MALTTAQEYEAVRTAIQTLTSSGQPIASFNIDGIAVSYTSQQLPWLQSRETELAKRLSQKNVRKRTFPDFTEDASSGSNPL